MTAPLEIIATSPIDPHVDLLRRQRAAIALVIACAAWGGSFTWAKSAMAAINLRAGNVETHLLGVLLLLGWRFGIAGVLWVIAFPGARKGWSWQSIGRASALGGMFTIGMIGQQMGLGRTSEAVSAFLTSLSILFVPLIMAIVLRRPPAGSMWIGVALATGGIWLMTGATPEGFGLGEVLGVICSIIFSIHIIMLNPIVERDSPWRMSGGQFIVIGILALGFAILKFPEARDPKILFIPFEPGLRLTVGLLIGISTLVGFGLMMFFQPRVDPTRAAVAYLTEPIFAALFAWLAIGRSMSAPAITGAILILAANGIAEWIQARRRILKTEEI